MARIIESRRRFKSRLDAKQDVSRPIPALMGDGAGTIDVPNQPGFVYIRVGDGDLGQAFNNRVPRADNLAIDVGYDPITDPDRRIFQVLSVRMADYAGGGNTPYPNLPNHHEMHEFGGGDDVYLSWHRLMGLRVGRPSGYSVTVDEGFILRAGAWLAVLAQTLDLTASKPALATQARYVLITLNSAGVATATNGALVAVGALDISDCPIPAAGEIPLAAVRMYGTQTSIGDTPSAPDIIDLRFPQAASTGSVYLADLQKGTAQYQIITSGANPYPAGWSAFKVRGTAGGITNLAVTNAKTLTLTSIDDYNLTAERTGAVIVRSATPSIVGDISGDGRGIWAVDLQLTRTLSSQVASGNFAVVAGGDSNVSSGAWSANLGGFANVSSGLCSTVLGGYASTAAGDYSVASGRRAKINSLHDGSFLFADQTDADFNSIVADEFAIRARGGFRHAWDDSNYWQATVSAAGAVTLDATGANAGFTFSDVVTLPAAGLVVTGMARGDILTGNATPAFARLALGGAAGSFLTRDATDVIWSGFYLAGTAAQTYTFPAAGGTVATLNAANAFTESNTIASGKFLTCLTDGNTGGLRAGSGSDVLLYRGGADLWRTPDSLTVDVGLNVGTASGATAGQIRASAALMLSGATQGQFAQQAITNLADHGKTLIGLVAADNAIAIIQCVGTADMAMYILKGGFNATTEVFDPSNKYSNTEDADGTTNIYWDAGNARYELNNELGATTSYNVWIFRNT